MIASWRDPRPSVASVAIAVLGFALALFLLTSGFAQTTLPELRQVLTGLYLGVPSWVFLLGGIYQISIVIMMVMPRTRVAGFIHAGFFGLATVGFNFLGENTLLLIPLSLLAAAVGFVVAWYTSERDSKGIDVDIESASDGRLRSTSVG